MAEKDIDDLRLKLNLDDILSRSDFEWQQYVIDEPAQAAEVIITLLEYVRVVEKLGG